jgi:hypothetical protein
MWFYNYQRSREVGGGVAREEKKLHIPTTAPKMLTSEQMYSRLNYQEKVRPEVIRRWGLQNDLAQNSDDDEETAQARRERAKLPIPINFKMGVAGDLLANESQEVKEYIEVRRHNEMKSVDEEEDEEERLRRLHVQAGYVRS